jgi:hypothetical protein
MYLDNRDDYSCFFISFIAENHLQASYFSFNYWTDKAARLQIHVNFHEIFGNEFKS